jgi:tape measure domain-containing protein
VAITLGDVIVKIRGDRSGLDRTFDQAERRSRGFASSIAGFLQNSLSFAVGGLIERGLQSITAGIAGLGRTAFGAVQSNERLQLSLESLVASQLKASSTTLSMNDALAAASPIAEELYSWVQRLAAKSPFDEEGAAAALQTALSYRFTTERSKELVQALVDQAAAAGKSTEAVERATVALGQMNVKGKVSAEELNQLREAGVDANRALEVMGVTLDDVAQGNVRADEFVSALLTTLEDVEGAAERQATSWAGLTTTISALTRTGLRTFFEGILKPLQPLTVKLVDLLSNQDMLNGAKELGQAIGDILAPAVEWLGNQLERLPDLFRSASGFIRQLRDELSGISAAELLGQIGPGLEKIQENMRTTLDALAQSHQGALAKMEQQIDEAGDRMGEEMVKIAEKYGPKILEVEKRIRRQQEDFDEALVEQRERAAKKRGDIQERIVKTSEALEERLTEIKADHQRKRQQLATSLLTAESEEQYLQIQAQIDAEDDKFEKQKSKAKEAGKDQLKELKARLKEEEKEAEKAEAKLVKRRERALGDLMEQLNEIRAERRKEESAVKETYANEVQALKDKIEQEKELYQQRVDELTTMFEEQARAFEEETRARAAALGTGLAAEVAGWVQTGLDAFEELKTTVGQFLTDYAEPLTGALIGIGAVLVGGGVIAAVGALAGALAGISLPIVAIIAATALLYTAWVQNWGGIQEKTAEVLAWLESTTQSTLASATAWWEEHGGAVRTIIGWVAAIVMVKLEEIKAWWQAHGDAVLALLALMWDNIKISFEGALAILTELIEAFAALIEGDWGRFLEHIGNAWEAGWNTVTRIFENNVEAWKIMAGEMVENIVSTFTDKDWGEIGSNIIGGIIEGLKSKASDLADAASEAGSDLLGSMQDFFGIDSPSKLFKEKIGKQISAGIGEGVLAGVGEIKGSLAQAMAGLTPGLGQPALAAAGGPRTIQFSQTNNLPQAPAGFDREGMMDEINQNTLGLIMKVFEDEEEE